MSRPESRPLRILMTLSNPFVSDTRVMQEADALVKAGHEVTVLCHDKDWDGSLPSEEERSGVSIVRLRDSPVNRRLRAGLPTSGILSKARGAHDLWLHRHFWRNACRWTKGKRFDLVHCHDLDTLPIGNLLKERRGVRLLYDSHEVFPWMLAGWLPSPLVDGFAAMERNMAPRADWVVTVGRVHERYFRRMGCRNVSIVTNCKDLPPGGYREPSSDARPRLLYIGVLKRGRMLVQAVRACEASGWTAVVGGFGPMEGRVRAECEKRGMVWLGRVPPDKVMELTLDSDAVLSMYDPRNLNNRIGPSNKLFEAMAAGRPSLVTEGTYAASVVRREGCGRAVRFRSDELASELSRLSNDRQALAGMGRRGYEAAVREYNWPAQAKVLLDAVERAAGHRLSR